MTRFIEIPRDSISQVNNIVRLTHHVEFLLHRRLLICGTSYAISWSYLMMPGSGKLDYKINSPLTNITEFYSKGFNLTIPSDSNLPIKARNVALRKPRMVGIFKTIASWGSIQSTIMLGLPQLGHSLHLAQIPTSQILLIN